MLKYRTTQRVDYISCSKDDSCQMFTFLEPEHYLINVKKQKNGPLNLSLYVPEAGRREHQMTEEKREMTQRVCLCEFSCNNTQSSMLLPRSPDHLLMEKVDLEVGTNLKQALPSPVD